MLKRLSSRERFEALLVQLSPDVRKAFNEAIADLRDNVQIGLFIERMERRDIEGAIAALNIDPAAFRPLERSILAAFEGGGAEFVSNMPTLRDPLGGKVIFRFDARAPRAELYARDYSARLVTRLVQDQRDAVRAGIQSALNVGRNPNSTALDLAGRVNRVSGRREGGIIGLSSPQAQYVATARQELASGNPTMLRSYLSRTRRDRRFDRAATAAIKDETPIAAEMINRMVGRYSDRLLQTRAEAIARTETMTALHAAKDEAFRQAVDTGVIQEAQVRKVWIATRDKNSRDHHAAADRERVGMNERFSTGLMFPHEPGAPASETINCRCDYEFDIDFLFGIENT